MAVAPGARLGPYQLLDLIGAGGVGEVYRARDTRLERVVAVKVLRSESSRPLRRERFKREALTASSLSHPHICALFDVGEQDGVDFLVMEYLEGDTLHDRLEKGPLPLEQVLRHGVAIADALANAHRRGIVHRDLKPANIMLTDTGAKLLDFGLAKRRAERSSLLSSESTDEMTGEGAILGTLLYMSPEQLQGEDADARSDIFAFGLVLHEMTTGTRAFDGKSQAALIAAIMSAEPPVASTLRPDCPPALDHVVKACLAKAPRDRWQTADDLLLELRWIVQDGARLGNVALEPRRTWRAFAWWGGAALAVAALVLAVLGRLRPEPLPVASSSQVTSAPGWEADPALSPDGGLIAYSSDESGNPDIWITDVHGGKAIQLTDDPAADREPAWFPDGGAIAFVSERGGRKAIWRVLRFGGAPSLLVADAEDPAIAPDGSRIAFARPGPTGERRIWVAPVEDPTRARILTGDGNGLWDHRHPSWSPDGRTICYQAERDLWLVSVTGQGAQRLTEDDEADVEPTWSADGRHVYFSSLRGGAWALWRVAVRGGRPERITLGTGPERHPNISRDGKRLAYSTFIATPDLTLLDLSTRKENRLRGLNAISPAWAPDGRSLAFASARIGGRFDLWIQPVSEQAASGPARRLTDQPGSVAHCAYSPDGRWIAYYRVLAGQRDIWTVPAAGGEPVQFTNDAAADIHPAWSPDGAQLAFASERDGASRIWVAPVVGGRPAGPARRLTSGPTTDMAPAWSPDGIWIAYVGAAATGAQDVWVVDASGSGTPRMLATEGRAGQVVWDRSSKLLFVSGEWDQGVSLRKYGLDTGRRMSLDPPIHFGQNPALIEFDISRDGRVVAFGRDDLRGDIWALEFSGHPY